MKIKLIAVALFITTGLAIALYPAVQPGGAIIKPHNNMGSIAPFANERPEIEVVFVLDTTGSMGGLIQAAKEKIWSIASTMAAAQPAPLIRMGLVAYRDRGDQYVTRVVDLSEDLDSVYATLMDFQADGGGDGPESVNQALYDAVHSMSWSSNRNGYRAIFLVGDAPPHMDYQDEVKYPQTLTVAMERGIVINTVQCGGETETLNVWRQIARLGDGSYFQVEQGGSAVVIATPFDEKIASLSGELDDTRLYYGSAEEKVKQQAKLAAAAKARAESSPATLARRGAFNASAGGAANFLGEGELVEDVASGRVELSKLDKAMLPEPLQAMAPAAQEALVKAQAVKREELKQEIQDLTAQRKDYLREKVAAAGGARMSLDESIYQAVRAQAGKKGFEYKSATADY
jgi:Mg-chelatase subunit ChlD